MRDDDQDDDDALPTHEELVAKWAWKPGEREQSEREMAERQQQIDYDKTLAWCRQRNETREAEPMQRRDIPRDALGQPLNDPRYRLDPDTINKASPAQPQATASAPAAMSRDWRDYIARQLDKRERAMAKAVAHTVIAEEKAREKTNAELRQKIDALETRLAEQQAQIERLEAAGKAAPIRLAG